MNKSYPTRGTSVNTAAAKPRSKPAGASTHSAARNPATFTPYHWEAYNEIVEPRRFDHYLIRKWLPQLGGDGLAVVKVLRDRCYHNPTTGVLRNEVEIDMTELAAACGIGERTLRRLLKENAALAQFIQPIAQYRVVGHMTRRKANAYRVCMDEPIHPDDLELYDNLRAAREIERAPAPKTRIVPEETEANSFTGQNGRYKDSEPAFTGQNGRYNSGHFGRHNSGQNGRAIVNLPSESLTKEENTLRGCASASDGGVSPINPPRGKGENADTDACSVDSHVCEWDPLQSSWNVALELLKEVVNAPTLNAHLKPMRLVSVTDTEAVLLAPSAFARNWIEGRHKAEVEATLAESLGRPVTVQITTGGK